MADRDRTLDSTLSAVATPRHRMAVRFWLIVLGYAAAVLAATFVTLIVFFIIGSTNSTAGQGVFVFVKSIFAAVPFGAIMTAVYGFPGWLAAMCVGLWGRISARWFYIIAGGLNGIVAIIIFSLFDSPFSLNTNPVLRLPRFEDIIAIYVPCFVGGLAGGLMYWLIAGRHSRMWRKSAT
jgi:hypothetical protein